MTLFDYFYNNTPANRKFSRDFPECTVKNAKEMWDLFISKTIATKDYAIAWHKLLIKYIFDEDSPILFCRLYESGGYTYPNEVRIDEIRRTALTKDGKVRYMFVSNYDAAEMCNIVYKGVEANLKEFRDLIENKQYKLHYQKKSLIDSKEEFLKYKSKHAFPKKISKKSIQEESYILSGYPEIGTVKGSVLNESKRYLAHIIGVKDTAFQLPSGKLVSGDILKTILPKGNIEQWSEMPNSIRIIDTNLSEENIAIIKAHFLRFFDPLNYFVTPSKSNHLVKGNLSAATNIGEYWEIQKYVEQEYDKIYGKEVMDEFRKFALVPDCEDKKYQLVNNKTDEINTFSEVIIKSGINKKNATKNNKKISEKKISKREIIFKLAKEYIEKSISNNKIKSFNDFNSAFPGLSSLVSKIKDTTRYFDEIIELPNKDKIKISNQIGDKPNFPINRNYSLLIEKFKKEGIFVNRN